MYLVLIEMPLFAGRRKMSQHYAYLKKSLIFTSEEKHELNICNI